MRVVSVGIVMHLHLQAALCVLISLNNAGVTEMVKIWSIAQYLFRGGKEDILQNIYPIVTQLDDELEEFVGSNLCSTVANRIFEMGEPDLASLMPLYCQWYPMGISHFYTASTSNELYFVLNGKRYKNSDDMFYLKSRELKMQTKIPDSDIITPGEVVIGYNQDAPIVHFYGCPDGDGEFDEFNRNLYSEATQTGKLRLIWRPTCPLQDTAVGPFSVGLTINKRSELRQLPQEALKVPENFEEAKYGLRTPNEKELSNLDLKVASLIVEHYQNGQNFTSTLEYAKGLANNFPIVVPELISMDKNNDPIIESNEQLANMGVDYHLLGLYLNGQNWKVSSLNEYTLLNALEQEYHKLNQLLRILRKIDNQSTLVTAKELVNKFAEISLPNLQQAQPIKLDLHRIRGFSECVIYFNDIEIDDQYRDLTLDIGKFFDKSKFGELPEYRHNWSELIFVIDFNNLQDSDTKLALEGLKRAISVITQGYPQRVGLLPLNTGDANNIIKKIYELKDLDLLLLEDFLGDELIRGGRFFSDYQNAPAVAKLLQNLQINQTSIIINGEIYPFRKNTWHYLVAKTIKKDTTFLKSELRKYIKYDGGKTQPVIDVRGVLHLKSSGSKHAKYTPDYFADSTYTTMDCSVLKVWDDRIAEYVKGKEYNVLHTVTLVDDFNTLQAVKRLHNLINVKFVGVRFKIIHAGTLSSNWETLKKISSKPSFAADLKSMMKKYSYGEPIQQLEHTVLQKWLPDLTSQYFAATSFMIINGRFLHFEINEVPQTKLFEATIKREAQRTLDTLNALEMIYPGFSERKINSEIIEETSAIATKMFYQGTDLYRNSPDYTTETSMSRFDLTSMLPANNFSIFQSVNHEKRPIDLMLIIDPLEERTQKFYSLIDNVKDLPFVNVKIVIYPTADLKIMPIDRIFVQDLDNNLSHQLPEIAQNFDVELEAPNNLVVTSSDHVTGYVIEVHVFDKEDAVSQGVVDGVGGICLELVNAEGEIVDQSITMKTFGYGQFIVPDLGSNYSVKSCEPQYKVTSFASDARADFFPVESITVTDLNPVKVYVKVERLHTDAQVLEEERDVINILTVLKNEASNEDHYKKMVLAVLQSQRQPVKFWILDQPFISASLKVFAEAVNSDSQLDGTIEFIRYEWPSWLRPQRFLDKRIDAFKILFLDVLFPQKVSKVIYMDPDISQLPDPFKLNEKVKTKSPFAMFKMTGHGYWELGYWAKRLGDNNLRFHSVEPIFIVNLKVLRDIDGGSKLRIHYQRLSADVNSLAKIDQDLVNDVQEEVPIRALSHSTVQYLKVDQDMIKKWLKDHDKVLANGNTGERYENEENSHDEL